MNDKNEETSYIIFILIKNKISYNFTIEKIKNDSFIIKCLPYHAKFDKGNLSKLFSLNLDNIKEDYNFICDLFFNNQVDIYEINNIHIILIIKYNIDKNNNIRYI